MPVTQQGFFTKAFCSSALLAILLSQAVSQAAVVPLDTEQKLMLEKAAREGNSDAVLELGLALENGSYGEVDYGQAVRLLQQAAELGNGYAWAELGRLHEAGVQVEQGYDRAKACYEKSVSLGCPAGHLRLGMLYFDGWGVEKNVETCVRHLRLAAEANYRPAQIILSDLLGAGFSRYPEARKEALLWAEKAASGDDPDGAITLGDRYYCKSMRSQDLELARHWYLRSAKQEYSDAMLAMANTFLLRGGGSADEVQLGLRWLELSVENGNREAPYILAHVKCLRTGEPVETAELVRLLKIGKERGENFSQEVLAYIDEGMAPHDAFRKICTTTFEERYIERNDKAHAAEMALPTHGPLVTHMPRPRYPRAMHLQQIEGTVMLEFVVEIDGSVQKVRALEASHPAFVEPSIEAVRSYRFIPGRKDGRLVKVRMKVPLCYRMSETLDYVEDQ